MAKFQGWGKGLLAFAKDRTVEEISNALCADVHDNVMQAAMIASEQLDFDLFDKLINVARMLGMEEYGEIKIDSIGKDGDVDPYTDKIDLVFTNTKPAFIGFVKKFMAKYGHEIETSADGNRCVYMIQPSNASIVLEKLAMVDGISVSHLTSKIVKEKDHASAKQGIKKQQ